jgi:pentatricopeptide repeat protein
VTFNTAISASLRHRRPRTAVRLFLSLLSLSPPDAISFRLILSACEHFNDLSFFLQIHAWLAKMGAFLSESDLLVLYTKMVALCFKLGLENHARKLFDRMPERDAMAFSAMMVGYGDVGSFRHGLVVFVKMLEGGTVEMNAHAYSCVLHSCACNLDLQMGRQIHGHVIKSGFVSDAFVGTGLVDLYAKCDAMNCARAVFSEICVPSVVSWNALLAGNLTGAECLNLFNMMRKNDIQPDKITFGSVLQSLKSSNAPLFVLMQLHGLALKMVDIPSDVFISSALFEAYIDQDCFFEAERVAEEMSEKDDGAINVIIQGYVKNGYEEEATFTLMEALRHNKVVREVTLSALLININLCRGKVLHALFVKLGCFSSERKYEFIVSALIRMYIAHKVLDHAILLFDHVHEPDIVQWSSLLSAFSQIGENDLALKFYRRMLNEESVGPANEYTYSTLLSSCADLAAIQEGKQIHARIIKSGYGMESDTFVVSSLMQMYAKCGCLEEARILFEEMPERDLASWNTMIGALSLHGFAHEAIEVFQQLHTKENVPPDDITMVAILSACGRAGMVEKGYKYFKSIKKPTVDHYACLVDMLGRAGRLKEAIGIVQNMPYDANEHIWSSLLSATIMHGNVHIGEYSAKQLFKLNPEDPGNYIALSNLYASARRWKDVREVRRLMQSRASRKQPGVSWFGTVEAGNIIFTANGNGESKGW